MKTFLSVFLIVGAALALDSCVNPTPSWSFGREKYRIKGAQYARLGTVGERNRYGVTDFQPKTTPDLTDVPVLLATEAYKGVDSDAEAKANLSAAYPNVSGKLNADLMRKKVEKGNYKVIKLADVDRLIEKLQTQPRIIERLKSKDSRIITAVVVVYDSDETTILKAGGGADVSAKITGSTTDPKLSFSGSAGSTTQVKVKDGYVIGYEMSAPVWKNDKLTDFKVDKIGWGG